MGFTITGLIIAQMLSGCGQGVRAGDSPREPAAAPSVLRSASTSASADVKAIVAPTPPAASAPPLTSDSAPILVYEVRMPVGVKRLSVSASGKIMVKSTFGTLPDQIGFGQVPSDRVEELHQVLRAADFCSLVPRHRESSPGYIVIEAHFSDVACAVELPTARWNKDPKAKKVVDAMRTLEDEGCPTGCKR